MRLPWFPLVPRELRTDLGHYGSVLKIQVAVINFSGVTFMHGNLRRIVLGWLLMSGVVATAAAADQIPTDRTITKIYAYTTYAVVRFSPEFSSTQGCTGLAILQNDTLVIDFCAQKVQYATVLAAYLTGKKVGFGVNGCSPNFGNGVPVVYRVEVAD